jgi:hypothetical protein
MSTANNNHIGELSTLERNRFFYGKLMDVSQFEKDQLYFNSKRALINRLVLGNGVVCGFDVIADPDDENRLLIQPGLAIDGRGREIVSSEAISIDPHQLTNDQGVVEGDPIDSGTIEICLLYREVETDLVPVLVPDCDGDGNCAPCTIREEFRVLVRLADNDSPSPPICQFGEIPLAENGNLHALLCERLRGPCPPVPDDICVPIARVLLPLAEDSIDPCSARPLIYNNNVLYELILCLIAQVEALSQGLFLRIVSGNGQTGAPGEQLSDPLIVEMLDAEGNPVTNGLILFEVTQGGGSVSRETSRTNLQGRAQVRWILGPEAGGQQVTASAAGSVFTVTFGATAA